MPEKTRGESIGTSDSRVVSGAGIPAQSIGRDCFAGRAGGGGPAILSLALMSSINSMGVMPQMASGENWLRPSETAPISFPLMYTGLPLMPLGDIGARCLAAHFADDDVLSGTPHILRNPDDLHRHRFRFGPLEHGPGGTFHALLDFAHRHDFSLTGFWA